MSIVKRYPTRERFLDRGFNRFFSDFPELFPRFHTAWWPTNTEDGDFVPMIELIEKEGHYILRAEIPGVMKEDIDISIDNDILKLKGEKKSMEESVESECYCSERSYGHFLRTIHLPSGVDSEKIDAKYNNGVLEVTLPKKEEVKVKEIKLKVA